MPMFIGTHGNTLTNFVVQQSHEHGIIKTSLVVLPQGTINTATIFDLQSYCTQSTELVREKERETAII